MKNIEHTGYKSKNYGINISFGQNIFFVILLLINSLAYSADNIPIFDSHSHFKTEDAKLFSADDIIAKMDRERITHMVIIGEPPQRAEQLYQAAPDRIIPFLGLYRSYRDKAGWMFDEELPDRLEELLKQGHYKGIGEIHIFKQSRRNSNFKRILELANKNNLPVLIHGDKEVIDQVFDWFPRLTIIWAHMGTEPEPALLEQMLNHYPDHLYIDTSVRDERLIENGRLLPEWRQLFVTYPDRFLVAIDTFYTPRWQKINEVTQRIRHWLSFLPKDVAEKLAYQNARSLLIRQ